LEARRVQNQPASEENVLRRVSILNLVLSLAGCLADFMKKQNLNYIHWILLAVAALVVGAGCSLILQGRSSELCSDGHSSEVTMPEFVVKDGLLFSYPTAQTQLENPEDSTVFMPTASGKVESAAYGSSRTGKFGSRYLAKFHEGVDIAPLERDAKGRAQDVVFAVADGRVGYISRRAENSSYGTYVVLLHEDRLGEFYTLYAHLSSVPEELSAGDPVTRGTPIGQMGSTSTLGIPVQRSHLHFEFGTQVNSRFDDWLRSKKMTRTHGVMHGWNLVGLNPAELFPAMKEQTHFVFESCIFETPVAFRLIVKGNEKPDYYCRYPTLWIGDAPGEAMVLEVSEGGVPLRGRSATEDELISLGSQRSQVLEAFPDVLGRNGKRLVISKGDRWVAGANLSQWLEILLY
jgi:murein DD-endopeptidase MepM/ murein hydrolase activator NlpD